MATRTQTNRKLAIGTPLGDDVLLLKSFHGSEQLGRLFQYEVELRSEDHDIQFDDIVGENVTVRLELPTEETRYFNGHICRFVQTSPRSELACYKATIVPWLWFLTRTADCRIFQQMAVPDIIQAIFATHGFSDVEVNYSGNHRTWEYCVQYRETDFNFVSRLMEQEGIYYYFKHENGKHTLMLVDSPSAHEASPGYESILYRPEGQMGADIGDINEWTTEKNVQAGLYALTDFDFEKPKKSLLVKKNIPRQHAASEYEVFDFPGEYIEFTDGEAYAEMRIQELHAQHEILTGRARAQGLQAGFKFKLEEHPRKDQNCEYLVTGVHYDIRGDDYEGSRLNGDPSTSFECTVTAIPATAHFRPARLTPKPVIQGPQTAMVVGPSGEEIHTDKYGRVKVQFPWDRYNKADENASCWVRVSQPWAGKGWGAINIPRIGQEVIVEFLEGDPDEPIITGRVYNGVAKVPYDLPAKKTISTFKTNSSKGGGGFNEFRFEDEKGKEQIFIHAERNQDVRIKADCFEYIGNERHLIVYKDQLEIVEKDKHGIVKGDQLAKVEGDKHLEVGGSQLEKITTDYHREIKGECKEKVGGDAHLKVAGNINEETGQKISIKAGTDIHEKAGMNYGMDAGMAVHIKAGMTLVLEAGIQLSLKVGGNFIDIGPAGVAIQGTMVMINSGGAAGSGGGSSPTAPAAPDPPDTPKEAQPAATADPGEVDEPMEPPEPPEPVTYSSSALVLKAASASGAAFCET